MMLFLDFEGGKNGIFSQRRPSGREKERGSNTEACPLIALFSDFANCLSFSINFMIN